MVSTEENKESDIIVLKFADSRIPLFKEARNKDYILYGEDNKYAEYLTYLYNKSGKHNAIIGGKAFYTFGKGFENGNVKINRLGESLNDISKKAILDIEIYGGFRLEVIWNRVGKIAEIYHVDFTTIRVGKEEGFYYKECWTDKYDRIEPEFIPAFNPANPVGSQIFAYNEYRPMVRFYPLPSYIGCNNYIETDIEISKFYLSSIRNGMMPSKMIQFFKGEPSEDKKRDIEKRFGDKFTGAEKAGRFILVFNSGEKETVKIDDLSGTELDKMFVELNKTCQQEIFSGHQVTSPMLFGIKTEGQLGGNTELYTAYSIFQNTYSIPKAEAYSKEINYLFGFSNFPAAYELQPTDPIGLQFDVKDVINSLPKAFVFDKMGIPKEFWNMENIGADNRGTPTIPIAPNTQQSPAGLSNDNIKNLSAKQHQQLMRIIRQYGKGQLTEPAARTLLRTSLNLSDEDINSILGIGTAAMSFEEQEPDIIAMFDACGDSKNDYEILKSKKVCFESELEAEADEAIYIQEAFKTFDVTTSENAILELIKKDPRITAEVIASAIGETVAYVESKISNLTKKGYLESTTEMIGADEITVRTVPQINITTPPTTGSTNPAQIFIKYSYEGPQDAKNRPFCAKMMQLNRLYSRADIEKISERLGYSVFDRRGGFWTRKGTNNTTPYCRHLWKSNLLVKKGGNN